MLIYLEITTRRYLYATNIDGRITAGAERLREGEALSAAPVPYSAHELRYCLPPHSGVEAQNCAMY